MGVEVAGDHEGSSRRAARRIAVAFRRKPGLLLGLATGETPTRTYARCAGGRVRRLRVGTTGCKVALPFETGARKPIDLWWAPSPK